ncbi:MAG: DUF3990 domain-containing protein [Bacilli bacterium]|nr:DUF3990 domain-containing protein [Bacilli bacterium]
MILYHGSEFKTIRPRFELGKMNNDYGRGFYCTESLKLASEWACKNGNNGFANQYELDCNGLRSLNLLDGKYCILHWMAILLENRSFSLTTDIAIKSAKWLRSKYHIDLIEYDVVIGYRADDSYFAFASMFVNNGISLQKLSRAFYLGDLGTQVVLISPKAFDNLTYIDSSFADKNIYYKRFTDRDLSARYSFRKMRTEDDGKDVYISDLMKMSEDEIDECIQRIISR